MRIPSWSFVTLILVGLVGAWFVLKPKNADPQAALTSHPVEVFHDADSPVEGNPKGDVTLVEFFDYNCPYCRQTVPLIAQMEAADPRLRVVYKEFPILGPGSVLAAKAALAAHRQEKFIEFHRALYQIRGPVDEGRALRAAEEAGLDMTRLRSDMQDPAIEAMLSKNLALARQLGIDDTPGFVIGRQILAGFTRLNVLQAAVRSARGSCPREGGGGIRFSVRKCDNENARAVSFFDLCETAQPASLFHRRLFQGRSQIAKWM